MRSETECTPLEAYRRLKGLKQRELAEKLGISGSCLCLLEAGKRQPGPTLAKRIEELLGIPKAQLRPDLWD